MDRRGQRGLWILVLLMILGSVLAAVTDEEAGSIEEESVQVNSDVLVLDARNFTSSVEEIPFLVVEFYAPWCGHCKRLAPEYEKAATALKHHDPPILFAKCDVNEEANKPLAAEFGVKGFPTLKIIKNKGAVIQDYKGPRDADGIIAFLKKQVGPPSALLASAAEVQEFVTANHGGLIVIGFFANLQSEEFANYSKVADELRADYGFAHTFEAVHLSGYGPLLFKPSIRLMKNFDDGYSDSTDFSVESISTFLVTESLPLVTVMSKDPQNRSSLMKFFQSTKSKVFLFDGADDTEDDEEAEEDINTGLRAKFEELAKLTKPKDLIFLYASKAESDGAMKYFGVEESNLPAVVVQDSNEKKYILKSADSQLLSTWLNDFLEGKLEPFMKSEAVPATNDEPVKVVVAKTLDEMVLKSKKDVLLEFYAPWCGHCKKLAPILDEVALVFQNQADVMIAKIDATANDLPGTTFEVTGFPTLFLHSSSGTITRYEGDRSKEDIISFINANRSSKLDSSSSEAEVIQGAVVQDPIAQETVKDEL